MAELPQITGWELGDDGDIIETRRFEDGTETQVRPMEDGVLSSEDAMRVLGFSEDIIELYSSTWNNPEIKGEKK